MKSRHDELHQALAVLAPPRRFELLMLLLSGVDRSVSQLASAVHLSQSCTSRHLQALQRAGLVRGVRDGKRVLFKPAPRGAAAAGVLASLVDDGWVPAEPAPPPEMARVPTPVSASEPSSEPSSEPAPEPRPLPPIAAVERVPAQAVQKSGNYSAGASPPARPRQVLEDYLL